MSLTSEQSKFLARHMNFLAPSERPPRIEAPDMTGWYKEVEAACEQLSVLSQSLRGLGDDNCNAVARYVEIVSARLSGPLSSPKALGKMENYLSSKALDIVEADNQFGVKINIRSRLLQELKNMTAAP